jgi:hypothetical protein
MNIIEKARNYWGKKAIDSQYINTASRKVAACNIKDAESIGILFNATDQVSFEIVKELVKDLTTKKNSIDVLGFVDSKQLIDHYLYRKGFDFFTRKQLNWYYKPEAENVKIFIEKPFDLLINLSLDEPYPILYILASSMAKFKAGIFIEGQEYLDFMIDIRKEKMAMEDLRHEIDLEISKPAAQNEDIEQIIASKTKTEIQLNFLINQLIHYLSLIKN